MTVDDYFTTGPPFERPIFERILEHLQTLDPDIWFEPVSVGIFFKRRSTFVSLRTMTKWIAVSFSLDRRLEHDRLSRKVVSHGTRYFHVVNVRSADDIDEQLLDWLTQAWHDDEGNTAVTQ